VNFKALFHIHSLKSGILELIPCVRLPLTSLFLLKFNLKIFAFFSVFKICNSDTLHILQIIHSAEISIFIEHTDIYMKDAFASLFPCTIFT